MTKKMPTIIFVLMAGFVIDFVAGCAPIEQKTQITPIHGTTITDVTHNGHQYIIFHSKMGYGEALQVLHDPDCPCRSKTLTEWQQLQLAIAITESKCNPSATGATQDFGILQLTPIYVKEANRVGGTEYAHEDAYDPLKSLSMFQAVQDYHNPEHDQNKAIKLHNKAPWYAQKVKDNLEFVQRYEAVRSLL